MQPDLFRFKADCLCELLRRIVLSFGDNGVSRESFKTSRETWSMCVCVCV